MVQDAVEPRRLWAVEFSHGGIPDDPTLFADLDMARRFLVETAAAEGLEWTDDCSDGWIGNDDDEVRLFGPLEVVSQLPETIKGEWTDYDDGRTNEYVHRPLNEAERAEVERVLALMREARRTDQEAREAVAELSTPDGGCG
jgi:hypothetical protein